MSAIGLIFLPLVAGLMAFLWPSRARALGVTAALGCLALAIHLAVAVSTEGPWSVAFGGWLPPLGIALFADGLTVVLLLIAATVGLGISAYAGAYFGKDNARDFWVLWLLLWAALNALFLAADLFNLYVTLELASLTAVALVALAGHRAALEAAFNYLLVGLGGSLIYLLGVALNYGRYGILDLGMLGEVATNDGVTAIALALMTAGLLLKTAVFPLHFWLPPAHGNAPTPVSAALSALVVKGSLYLILRLWLDAFPPVVTEASRLLLGLAGALAVLWGSLLALQAERLKGLIAYSTVAQLGYLILAVPLLGPTASAGVVYLLLAHALAKASLFLAAGTFARTAGDDRIETLAGIGRHQPHAFFGFGFAAASLIGLPPTGGFVGKWLVLNSALLQGEWLWAVVLVIGTLLSAGYLARVLVIAFAASGPADAGHPAVPGVLSLVPLVLGLASLGLGMITGPLFALLTVGRPGEVQLMEGFL